MTDFDELLLSAISGGSTQSDTMSTLLAERIVAILRRPETRSSVPMERGKIAFRRQVLRSLGVDYHGRRFGKQLAELLRASVEQVYDEHVHEATGPDTRRQSPVGWEAAVAASGELTRVAHELGIVQLVVLGRLSGGLSGSYVLKVSYSAVAGEEIFGILKLSRKLDEMSSEARGHRAAASSWLSAHTPTEPIHREFSDGGWAGLLSPLAFPARPRQDASDTLHDAIRIGQSTRCQRILTSVGRSYGQNFSNCARGTMRPLEIGSSFSLVMNTWKRPAQSQAWSDEDFWAEVGLPLPSETAFRDGDVVRPNPLRWHDHMARTQAIFWSSLQHGDLNTRNIVLSSDERPLYQFIDFEKSLTTNPLLDVAWLALWVARSGCNDGQLDDPTWSSMPRLITNAFLLGRAPDDFIHEAANGLNLVAAMGSSLAKAAGCKKKAVDRNETFQLHARIALGASALAMSYYDARRWIDSIGLDDPAQNRVRRLWSITYFRVASISLHDLFPTVRIADSMFDLNEAIAQRE